MASIDFYTNNQPLNGSGIGFYGSSGFGYSVAVNAYNGRTYITDSTGTAYGPEGNNVYYTATSSGIIGNAGSGVNILCVPDYQATLNARFSNSSPVRAQNAYLYSYDGVSLANPQSGVKIYAAQIVHPTTSQINNGSGNSTWTMISGATVLSCNNNFSPGMSGLSPNGASTTDTRHDYYFAISATPQSVGAKSWKLGFGLEYL
jgi:hypothetical protein